MPGRDHPPRSVVFEESDITKNRKFAITPDGFGRMIDGPGSIDTLLVVADSESFGVRVESDGDQSLVDALYPRLDMWSEELDHVSAYQARQGQYAISVTNFPFREWARTVVRVEDETTFEWVRAVFTLGAEVDY